jgi:outer membrane receptor protein involved in Fe transport
MRTKTLACCTSVLALGLATTAQAQSQPATPPPAADTLNEIIVTASVGNKTKLDTSVSISSVSAGTIQDFHPMSEGDMLRLLPGLQPNVSGPGGNGNFAVRGLPVATGGATFVQLQEDGLPTVLYGDIQFGNNDYWTKSSPTDERVEAIRGGTAATLASQAPGAVVNYISQTGRGEGGYVSLEKGVNYDWTKINFLDRGIINDSMYYNIGGYYDVGHGPWHASYNVSNSYLVKGNVTKELPDNRGYVRLLFKVADTQEPNSTGGVVCGNVSGNTDVWGGARVTNMATCGNLNIKNQSNYSLYNSGVTYFTGNGNLTTHALDGITTRQRAIQGQVHYKFDNGITLDDNARYNALSGGFASNFFSINPLSSLIGSTVNGSTVASAVYAAGPNAGKAVGEAYYNNNVNVYTDIRNLNSFVNDLKANWKGGSGDLRANLNVVWFFMSQQIGMDWHPSQFNAQASGNNPSPIDLLDATGNLISANGYTGYNTNWGGGNARSYDYTFSDNAPYADLILDYGRFELDSSLRYDINHGSGTGTSACYGYDSSNNCLANTHTLTQTATNPVTGAAQSVQIPYYVADGASEVVNYSKSLLSWSFGASYKALDNLNLFARASKGTRFNADRMTFNHYFTASGTLNAAGETAVADYVYQYELGLKNRGRIGAANYTVELTVYHSHFNITTEEISQSVCGAIGVCEIADRYRTTGVEFYGTMRYGGLSLIANATFNKSDKNPSATDPGIGQYAGTWIRSNGIPDLSYSLAANYAITPMVSVGGDLAGVTSTLDSNGLQYPGSAIVSANLKVTPVRNLELGVNVYNLFNSLALMGPGGANNLYSGTSFVGSASAAIGRTATASVKFSF